MAGHGWFFFDRRLVHNHNETFWLYGLAGVLLVLLLVLFWGVRQSHRVAVVVVRVNKELENAGRGVFPPGPVCFRQRDYFKWLAPSLDATLKHLQREGAKLTTLRLQVAGLEARLATGELQKPEDVLNEVQRIRQSSEN